MSRGRKRHRKKRERWARAHRRSRVRSIMTKFSFKMPLDALRRFAETVKRMNQVFSAERLKKQMELIAAACAPADVHRWHRAAAERLGRDE